MDHAYICQIRADWASVRPLAAIAIHRFYGHLLNQDASARVLVPEDFTLQGWKLIAFLDDLVARIDKPADWVPLVRGFTGCDAAQALIHRHFVVVGDALLRALADVLMDRFTPESRAAWSLAYELVANAIYAAGLEDHRAAA